MKTISIRDLRQRWPEAEAALEIEQEILITRDSRPVAKLVRVTPPKAKRKRWDPEAHRKWMKKVWGDQIFPDSSAKISAAREDRNLR